MLQKILFPTDFSDMALKALPFAIELAKKNKAELFILNTYQVPLAPPASMFTSREDTMKKMAVEMEAVSQRRLSEFIEQYITSENVDCKGVSSKGSPTTAIVQFANEHDIDLVVMGTHGETGDMNIFMGSVSKSVAQKTFCPVFVVPPKAEFSSLRSFLYATDLQSDEAFILKYVCGLAQQTNAEVLVLHVDRDSGNKKWSIQGLEKLIGELKYDGLSYHEKISKDVVSGILDFMNDKEVDCLAVTTHTTSIFDNLFHSSITEKLLFRTSKPMLIFNQGKSDIIVL